MKNDNFNNLIENFELTEEYIDKILECFVSSMENDEKSLDWYLETLKQLSEFKDKIEKYRDDYKEGLEVLLISFGVKGIQNFAIDLHKDYEKYFLGNNEDYLNLHNSLF